jgi:hypothetical protein
MADINRNKVDYKFKIPFSDIDDEANYAFDPANGKYNNNNIYSSHYNKLEDSGNYKLRWKFMQAGGTTDRVKVTIPTDIARTKDKLKFIITQNNTELAYTEGSTGDIELTLMPPSTSGEYSILAVVKALKDGKDTWHLAGRLDILAREHKTYNVTLVSLIADKEINETTESAVQEYLNSTWKKYGISWEVDVDNDFYVKAAGDNYNKQFINGFTEQDWANAWKEGDEFFSQYTSLQEDINRRYNTYASSIKKYDDTHMCVFILPENKTRTPGQLGDMPLGKQWGYLFVNNFGEAHYRTLSHELGHGRTALPHTFAGDNPDHIVPKGETTNLMDYSDYTNLVRAQWDMVHNPAIFTPLQSDGDGAIIGLHSIVRVNNSDLPAKTGTAAFFTPAGLPIYFDDMSKISAMYFTSKMVVEETNTELGNIITADKGVLVAFIYNGVLFASTYQASSSVSQTGRIKASDYYFVGYSGDYYYSNNTAKNGTEHSVFWYEGTSGSPFQEITLCFDYNKYINAKNCNPENYHGAGYFSTSIERKIQFSCSEYFEQQKELDKLDFFNKALYAKYNPWGNGGLLQKIQDREGNTRLLYSFKSDQGTTLYYEYDYIMEDFVAVNIGTAGFSSYMDLSFIADVALHYGHGSLDIIGFIPVAGEIADALNGLWFLIEGEKLDAILCFSSMVPVIGSVAVKGTKYTITALKGARLAMKVDLTAESLYLLGQIADLLKRGGKPLCEDCLNTFAKLLSELPENAADMVRLADKIDDPAKLKAVLDKIDGLGSMKASFLNDIKLTIGLPTNALANNLDRLDDGVVDAWSTLNKYYVDPLKKNNIVNLENLKAIQKSTKLESSGLSVARIDNIIAGNYGVRGASLENLLNGMKQLVESNVTFENIDVLTGIAGMQHSIQSFAEGSRWTMRYIVENPAEFSGKNLIFESVESIADGAGTLTRRADLKVGGSKIIFYEFKSVLNVPPVGFANQFLKDLRLADVSSLDQIKWYFDYRKIPTQVELLAKKGDFMNELIKVKDELYNSKAKALFEDLLDESFISSEQMINALSADNGWFNLIFTVK